MARILLVEDEVELAETISLWLKSEAHEVELAHDGQTAKELLRKWQFDLLVLDWMLPGLSGFELCTSYRASGGKAAIIMLTAKRSMNNKEEAFEAGVDDYLTKPFQLRELSARIKALLRRSKADSFQRSEYGDLLLDRDRHSFSRSGSEIHLLPKEFSIMELLLQTPGRVYSVEEIISHAWAETDVVPETVRSNIKSLRKKIDSPGQSSYITNVHGIGYKLEMPQC